MIWKAIAADPPPEGVAVIIFLPEANRGRPGCEVAQWWSGGDGYEGCWWTNGGPNAGEDMDDWHSATHWMPLPEFPA